MRSRLITSRSARILERQVIFRSLGPDDCVIACEGIACCSAIRGSWMDLPGDLKGQWLFRGGRPALRKHCPGAC